MVFLGELRVEARLESVRVILHFVNGVGQQLRLTEKTMFDLELAVEEAAVNIVRHAYPAEEKGDVLVSIHTEGEESVFVTLKDWGIPFDSKKVKPFDINEPIEVRIQGGMGLHFIQNLTDDLIREIAQRPGDANKLTLVKHVDRLRPGISQPSAMRELNAMLSVSQIMATGISLDDLLERIVNQLVETIEAERGTLYLIDEESDELYSRVLLADTGRLKEIRVKIGEGIAGKVAKLGHVMNVRDAYQDPNFRADFDSITGFRSQSVLAAPMRNRHQQIIGVVQLLNKLDGDFTTRDERLLVAMAAQAAISIENARLYEQEIRQQLINQELETARAIQQSFLPDLIPQHKNWDFATFWLPMRDVGGDFFDFYQLPDGRLAMLIADVSGKGVPAAMFMALSSTVLRFAMGLSFAPDELLDRANQLIISDQRSRMFATVFVMYLNRETGVAQYASAGHNPPLLYRRETGECHYLEASGVAMGLFTSAEYDTSTIELNPGDVLVMYTDGITEVINEEEEEFGEERLDALVAAHTHLSAQELSNLIVSSITRFSSGQGVMDDETLIVIKRVS